jgi:hypothetical protein
VAIESRDSLEATSKSPSLLENELPNYRAISGWAVGSLLMGLLSVFSFGNLMFLGASVLAFVFGGMALMKIRNSPELLTGKGLANTGIALGLICGAASATLTVTQSMILEQEAKKFGAEICKAFETGELAQGMWYFFPGFERAKKKPVEVLEQMRAGTRDPMEFDSVTSGVRAVQERLGSTKGQHIHVHSIEKKGLDGLTPMATLILEIHGPTSEKFPKEYQYARVTTKGQITDGKYDWNIENVMFPYEIGTLANEVDSAHGHDH